MPESDMPGTLLEYFERFITENKLKKFKEVLDMRTRHITVVMEDLYQSQNISAILRTAECFGLQDVYIIENNNSFELHPRIVMGATKWLTLHRFNDQKNNSEKCFSNLKKQGYRLVVATPHASAQTPDHFLFNDKTAFVFGTEITGISETALKMADDHIKIPMYGFTESFNVSVSAALLVSDAMQKIRTSSAEWKLTEKEKAQLYFEWLQKVLNKPHLLEKEFLKRSKKE